MCIRHLHRLTEEFDTETSALGRLNCSAVLASSWSPRNKMACFVLFWNSELTITFFVKKTAISIFIWRNLHQWYTNMTDCSFSLEPWHVYFQCFGSHLCHDNEKEALKSILFASFMVETSIQLRHSYFTQITMQLKCVKGWNCLSRLLWCYDREQAGISFWTK